MAYCKSCGQPLKDEDLTCPVCGAAIEQLEVVDDSQVEIVRARKKRTRVSLHADDYAKELTDNTFVVFDRKIIVCLFATLIFFALSFFVRTVDHGAFAATDILEAVLFAALIVTVTVPCLMRNRGLLIVCLIVTSGLLLIDGLKVLVLFDSTSAAAIVRTLLVAGVDFAFMTECIILDYEMLFGKRLLGAHCVMVVVVSVLLLAALILSLLVTPNNDMGVLVAVWQVMSVFGKITALCIMIFLFSNMGKIGIQAKF